ncbi:tripartite tricarboxylate transporter TctB family protein [Bosea sp. (in: a-proteobacteria)]|uniref:tripartite tricarboxylate transporter TctB family protein n=1 Tax=Bosea sp. (in: a-proteobacteria) TaxID=1871050 RepID=UPI001ACDFCA5|nr:tripartite tricarboxylate transporter TctB family protein [Bosea sp. (in: a-proteobacteria)]MBN9438811.1 tripartite tricarboxylate transporter TctB family protein [Bosea sp. (in: a-proteobacteria)]
MLPRKSLRRADVAMSTGMILLGASVIYAASGMPWQSTLTGGSAQWYLSPGLFPAVVGALLIAFSLRVLIIAIKEGGTEELVPATIAWLRCIGGNHRLHRAALAVGLMAAYIFLGIGRVPFLAASGIFLFVAIALFWWREAEGGLLRTVLITAAIAIGVPLLLSTLFTTFLYVPMPQPAG